jgi:hypothetical protein
LEGGKEIGDYIAAIDGYTYDEESHALAASKGNSCDGKAGIPILLGRIHCDYHR